MFRGTVYIGTDHWGFEYKTELIDWLKLEGFVVEDMGAHDLDPLDNFPDFIIPVAKAVSEDPENRRGVVIGRSGQGEAMAANRFINVRAVTYYQHNLEIVKLSREHNESNVFSLGLGFVKLDEAKEALKLWFETPVSNNPKYHTRVQMVEDNTK